MAILAAVAMVSTACTGMTEVASTASNKPDRTSESPESGADQTAKVSAILVQPMTQRAQVVHGSDGMDHVEYNLLVVNAFSDPVTLTEVTAVGPDGITLMRLEGGKLADATQSLYAHTPSPVVAASAAVAVELDLALRPNQVPKQITHRIEYTIPQGLAGASIIDGTVVHGPKVAVDRGKAITIAPPLAGGGWLATSACCTPNVHRDLRLSADGLRFATSETFAVDWALVMGNRLYDGNGSLNEQFYGFGADVLAVADGTVVAATDGAPESIPFNSTPAETKEGFGGNQVMIKIADGVYAAYGHLQPNSITVHVGDKVKAGDVLAALGNTGPSQGPHLHFGLLDAPDLFTGRSLPFVLPTFTLAGTVDFAASTGDEVAISPTSRSVRNSYPLYGTISEFP
jgi:hypothetical protein